MDHALSVARDAVREAGELVRAAWIRGDVATETKGVSVDLVTATDRAADELLAGRLRDAFPTDELVLEETGLHPGAAGTTRRWYIDPLDGTTNFAHGFPHFAVTLALEIDGVVELGVTLDVTRGEMYEAVRGGGAWVEGRRMSVSSTGDLGEALLATGFPYDRHRATDDNTREAKAFLKIARGLRRPGAAALDLAYVARGWLDGYWEMNLNPWDVAAGKLLVEEAGGRTSGYEGAPLDVHGGRYVASNGELHEAMLGVLAGARGR